mgnify:FL=1
MVVVARQAEEGIGEEIGAVGRRVQERIAALEAAHQEELEALEQTLLAREQEREREWEEKQERLLEDLERGEQDMLLRFDLQEKEVISQVADLLNANAQEQE